MKNIPFIGARLLLCVTILAEAAPTSEFADFSPEYWQAKWDAAKFIDASTFAATLQESSLQARDNITFHQNDLSDVCARVQGCIGSAAATAANWAAVKGWATASACSTLANSAANQMSANNYALAKQVAGYAFTNLVLPVVYQAPLGQLFINAAVQNDAPSGTKDDCGVSQTQAISEQVGTVTYGFCLQLRDITQDKAFSRFDYGTVSADNTNDDVGLDMKMRMFISTVKGKHDAACSLLGVYLKRLAA